MQETGLDSDGQIGNDIGHVDFKVFLPPRHSTSHRGRDDACRQSVCENFDRSL
jgi:hypothetical protein